MKQLLLVRHAKSSWDDASLTDQQRPLNARGKQDAPRIGRYISHHLPHPQHIFTSPATRAATTARLIAAEYPQPIMLTLSEDLYTFSGRALLACLRGLPDHYTTLMLVGHNPAMTDAVNQLCASDILNIPTCAVALVQIHSEHWSDCTRPCVLANYIRPKDL